MNTLKKIAFSIYSNWFGISMAVIALGCDMAHWSMKLFLWPIGAFVLFIIASNISNPIFAPIRIFTWPMIKQWAIKKCGTNALIGYPMLIWIELSGRSVFIRGGFNEFRKAWSEHIDKTIEKLKPADADLGTAQED